MRQRQGQDGEKEETGGEEMRRREVEGGEGTRKGQERIAWKRGREGEKGIEGGLKDKI